MGPSSVVAPLGVAPTRLRTLCVINLRNHKAMQRQVSQRLWRQLDSGSRRQVVTYMGAADMHNFMLRMADAGLVTVYFCLHHRLHPITRWVSIAQQLHGEPIEG